MALLSRAVVLPPPRPVLWPLRDVRTAEVSITELSDGRRRIIIDHAELAGVTPTMLAWWYGHIVGEMEYAGGIYPRYLVWHPLDHISYEFEGNRGMREAKPGTRLHVREAFQRNPNNLLDLHVTAERIDSEEATIVKVVLGMTVLRLQNKFTATSNGSQYQSVMTIGTSAWPRHLGLNRILQHRILPGAQAQAWVRHHVEEVGNLVNFLPDLYRRNHPIH